MNVAAKLRAQGIHVETVADILGDGDDTFRASHVGASEVAALFPEAGGSPWLTHFELWHRKAGTIATPDFGGNERIEWGIRLERPIIEAARDRYGYELLDTPERLDNGNGLGGHPDQLAYCPVRKSPGILEVKTVDWLVAKKWGEEPPIHYLLQDMSYQGLASVEWGDMIVLVGGNELRRFQYDFRPKLYSEIEARVAAFWQSVRTGKPPKPDFARDGDTLADLYSNADETVIDLRRDNRAAALAADYLAAKEAEKAATAQVDAIKAELLDKLGTNSVAMVEGFSVKCPTVAGTPDREITEADIGSIIKGRKAHRRFYIKEIA